MSIRKPYKVALVGVDEEDLGKIPVDKTVLSLRTFKSVNELAVLHGYYPDVIGISPGIDQAGAIHLCEKIRQVPELKKIPIMAGDTEGQKLLPVVLFEAGCSDIVDSNMTTREIELRVEKLVFSANAEQELKRSAEEARKVAMNVMTESSNLGLTVRFLIDSNFCDNVDELGMCLFQSTEHYNIHCSLQLRSHFGVKNMEETGLERELESRLLSELHQNGRFVDFGKRCIVNYGQVSLLIKNMPVDDKDQCTKIKDSILPFIQGADSRLKAIDAQRTLEIERNFMGKVVSRLRESMTDFDEAYQQLMRGSADTVEDMAAKTEESILFLDLTQEQEQTIEGIMSDGVKRINMLFSEGVKMNEGFSQLVSQMSAVFGRRGEVPTADKLMELSSKL